MKPGVRVIVVSALIVVVVLVVLLYVSRPPANASPQITVTRVSIDGSPSGLCEYLATSQPAAPFGVGTRTTFQVEWEIGCVSNSTPEESDLHSMYSQTPGFVLQSSDLPLTIKEGGSSDLTVSVLAPSSPYDGPLVFWVNASAG